MDKYNNFRETCHLFCKNIFASLFYAIWRVEKDVRRGKKGKGKTGFFFFSSRLLRREDKMRIRSLYALKETLL